VSKKYIAPSDEGAVSEADWGRDSRKVVIYTAIGVFFKLFSPSVFAFGESTSLVRGRHVAAAGLGIAKAFWNYNIAGCRFPLSQTFYYGIIG